MSNTSLDQITPPAATDIPEIPAPRHEWDTAHLVVSRGPRTGDGIPLRTPLVTIGRHRDNDIPLGDTTVSAWHAQIRVDGDRYLIADVGSFTGTYVNRQPVDVAELRHGDEVWIGRHRLQFHRPGAR
jgi:pSer/pThr/pTyr-binding forkhead associated (FHA) protein